VRDLYVGATEFWDFIRENEDKEAYAINEGVSSPYERESKRKHN
jgi:hypothetical protein